MESHHFTERELKTNVFLVWNFKAFIDTPFRTVRGKGRPR